MTGGLRRAVLVAFALTLGPGLALGPVIGAGVTSAVARDLTPPETPTESTFESLFGRTILDPYRWLEDTSAPDVIAWFRAQNDFTRSVLDALPGRAALHARLVSLNGVEIHVRDVQSAGDLLFYLKRTPADPAARLFVRDGILGAERLVLDPARFNRDGLLAAIEYFRVSPNGKRLAVGVSTGGSEDAVLHVMDVATQREIGPPIPRARAATPSWRFDSDILFYTQLRERGDDESVSEQLRGSRAFMRSFAAKGASSDIAILGSGLNPDIGIAADDMPTVHVSPVSPYAIGVISHGVRDEVSLYFVPLTQLRGAATPWRKLATLDRQITDFDLRGEWIYLLTHEEAPRYQVVRWSLRDPRPYALADAESVLPSSERVLRSLSVAKDALYVRETDAGYDALRRLEYNVKLRRVAVPAARTTGKTRAPVTRGPSALPKAAGIARGSVVPLPYRGAIEELVTDPMRAGAMLKIVGWTTAPAWLGVDGKTGIVTGTDWLPPAGVEWSGVTSKQVMIKSHDGVDVPVTLIFPKAVALDGGAPLLLEAYGAYGISKSPEFWPSLAAWLERGGIYAIAHVRGGGELGDDWHRGGYRETKPNSWRDLIAAAQWLIGNRWTAPAKLALLGSSAGGLAVSNAFLERPELFAAIVSQSGFHDALRSETGAAGPANVPEFGSIATESGLADLLAMSAYARVEDGVAYPAAMLTIGFRDARVDAWDPGKMAARLQAANASLGGSRMPVFLRVDFDAGHGSSPSQMVDETSDLFAFLLWQTGAPDFVLP